MGSRCSNGTSLEGWARRPYSTGQTTYFGEGHISTGLCATRGDVLGSTRRPASVSHATRMPPIYCAGAPLPVIAANLGHSDTRMTERHYAHLAPSHVAQVIRATMPKLGLLEPSPVMSIRPTPATARN
jgi:hypothetical protein